MAELKDAHDWDRLNGRIWIPDRPKRCYWCKKTKAEAKRDRDYKCEKRCTVKNKTYCYENRRCENHVNRNGMCTNHIKTKIYEQVIESGALR